MNAIQCCIFLISLIQLTCAASGIHEQKAIEIGGIKQWIDIRGEDASKPVLLFLHGGPGNSALSYADRFTNMLQKQFVIVFWDQRESGKTATLNDSSVPLSLELM